MAGKNIYQRVAAAMAEVKYIQNEFKKGMQYRIVSHDAVTAKVRPVLLNHGVHYRPLSIRHEQNGNRTECHMIVRFTNIDDPEDHFDVETLGYGVDTQDKGPGKAMSYAVKYALLKALGLETGEDADLDHQAEHQPQPKVESKVVVAEDWTASPDRQIAPATHEGLEAALQKKGLAWEVVRKMFADQHGRMLPANPAETPVAAVNKLRDLIKSQPDATSVEPEEAGLSDEEMAKVDEMRGAGAKVKVRKRGDA